MTDIANRRFLVDIECTVCLEAPKRDTRILQCNNGHLFCQICYPKLSKCPACRLKLASDVENGPGPIRCLLAENLIRKLSRHNVNDVKNEELDANKEALNQRPCLKNKIHEKNDSEFTMTRPLNSFNRQKDFGVYWGRRLPMDI